jgi:hypothetical protein
VVADVHVYQGYLKTADEFVDAKGFWAGATEGIVKHLSAY